MTQEERRYRPADDADEDEEEDLEVDDDLSDPRNPDHDLSEWAPASLPYEEKPWFIRRWVLIVVAVLVIIGLMLPVLAPLR
jgi:hypothetical protein